MAPFRPKLSKICAPSTKNGRFSGKKVSKSVRFTTAGSTSTWPKSGLTVASRAKLLPTLRRRSRPTLPKARGAVEERVARIGGPGLGAARGVGHEDERRARLHPADAGELGHARGEAALGLRHERQPVALVLALDVARGVDPPRLRVAGQEAQLREGDPHLRDQPCVVVVHRGVPHRVPRVVHPRVVEDDLVALDAGRAHLEAHAGEVVAPGIEVEREAVGLGALVAAREALHDPRRAPVVSRAPT